MFPDKNNLQIAPQGLVVLRLFWATGLATITLFSSPRSQRLTFRILNVHHPPSHLDRERASNPAYVTTGSAKGKALDDVCARFSRLHRHDTLPSPRRRALGSESSHSIPASTLALFCSVIPVLFDSVVRDATYLSLLPLTSDLCPPLD